MLGFKYDDPKTNDKRALNIADLDGAVPNHPVLVEHRGGHTLWVNTAALKLAKLDDQIIHRDHSSR